MECPSCGEEDYYFGVFGSSCKNKECKNGSFTTYRLDFSTPDKKIKDILGMMTSNLYRFPLRNNLDMLVWERNGIYISIQVVEPPFRSIVNEELNDVLLNEIKTFRYAEHLKVDGMKLTQNKVESIYRALKNKLRGDSE